MSSNGSSIARFLRRSATFFALQLLVAAIVIWFGAPGTSDHYLGAIRDKIERLEACEGPRMVLLGGSNVAFGIHSPLMQQSFQMETVNLGLQASLGLSFQLESYLQHARSGDVVVLSPEYHLLTSTEHQRGDQRWIDQMLEQCPETKRYFVGAKQDGWKHFLDHDGLWLAHQWVGRAFRSMRERETGNKIYGRSSFNEFGDLVAHYGHRPESMLPVSPVPPITPESIEHTVAILNEFSDACQRRGVSVYFSYPPLMDSLYVNCEASIEQLHRALVDRVELPLLNHPKEFVFPADQFYDTAYHLNQQAGEMRTRFIAEAIAREHFGSPGISLAHRR